MKPIHLNAARVNARLTQKEVCERLGISQSTMVAWEKEERFPPVPQLRAMCDLYGCTMDDIFVPKIQT